VSYPASGEAVGDAQIPARVDLALNLYRMMPCYPNMMHMVTFVERMAPQDRTRFWNECRSFAVSGLGRAIPNARAEQFAQRTHLHGAMVQLKGLDQHPDLLVGHMWGGDAHRFDDLLPVLASMSLRSQRGPRDRDAGNDVRNEAVEDWRRDQAAEDDNQEQDPNPQWLRSKSILDRQGCGEGRRLGAPIALAPAGLPDEEPDEAGQGRHDRDEGQPLGDRRGIASEDHTVLLGRDRYALKRAPRC
jgi:hypothetical protein